MSDKPAPKSVPSRFMNAAVAVFVGAVALQLAVVLLRQIMVPLIVIGCLAGTAAVLLVWRRRVSGRPSDEW